MRAGMDSRRCYAKDADFVFRRVADEVLLLPIRRNMGDLESIFTLNEVAARIWELLDGRRTLGEIRDALLSEFDAAPETIEADLAAFLLQLEEIGAVAEASA